MVRLSAMEEPMLFFLQFLKWSKKMDAAVTALTANVATLESDVAKVLDLLKDVQAQLAAGIDAADAAAIADANLKLAAANAALEAALPPPAPTGATGGA